MSVSVDYRQLELLSQFVGFIEALQDVQKIKGLLEDAKQVLAKKEELLGAEATKEGADKYAAEVEGKADALRIKMEEEANKHQIFMQLEKDKINKLNSDLNTRQKEVESLRAKMTEDAKVADTYKKLAAEELSKAKDAKEQADKVLAEAYALRSEYNEKVGQLKKVLG